MICCMSRERGACCTLAGAIIVKHCQQLGRVLSTSRSMYGARGLLVDNCTAAQRTSAHALHPAKKCAGPDGPLSKQ